MLKAIRILQLEHGQTAEGESDDDSEDEDKAADAQELDLELPHVSFRRMPCLAHTLKLIVKTAYVHYDSLIVKTRHLVGRIRKSSVAIEKLVERCGKSVITDCTTRWNSTFHMVQRLFNVKSSINDVLSEMGKAFVHVTT